MLIGNVPASDGRWWIGIPRLIGQTLLGIVTGGAWFRFEPPCTVVLLDRRTGKEIMRHRWRDCEVAQRDLEMIQRMLETLTVADFCREFGLVEPD